MMAAAAKKDQGRDTPGHRREQTPAGVVSNCSTIMTPIHDPRSDLAGCTQGGCTRPVGQVRKPRESNGCS